MLRYALRRSFEGEIVPVSKTVVLETTCVYECGEYVIKSDYAQGKEIKKAALPRGSIEVRMDSAFFSGEIIASLDAQGVDYTVSVPFERFAELKERIEARRWWGRIAAARAHRKTINQQRLNQVA
ncbi:MAG: hypothetical protein ACREA4_00435 [Nitrososphaera sp.]